MWSILGKCCTVLVAAVLMDSRLRKTPSIFHILVGPEQKRMSWTGLLIESLSQQKGSELLLCLVVVVSGCASGRTKTENVWTLRNHKIPLR